MSTATVATAVRERPILFSGPMVRAILAGTKTQTRRVITFSGCLDLDEADDRATLAGEVLRYGAPGDRLWVRERWRGHDLDGGTFYCCYRADGLGVAVHVEQWTPALQRACRVYMRAGGSMPGIHMPRFLSRLTLEVTEVRVQRLQEISEGDAVAEGLRGQDDPGHQSLARDEFAALWDAINLDRGYQRMKGTFSWKSNPWVWAITFRRLDAVR